MNLKENILTIQSYKFQALTTGDGITKGQLLYSDENTYAAVYNNSGQIAEKTSFKESGRPDFKRVFKYNTQRQLEEEKELLPDGSLHRKFIHSFNESGQNILWQMNEKGRGTTAKVISEYDAAGNKIIDRSFYKKDKYGGETSYKYNEQGRMIERTDLNADGSIYRIHHYTYDEAGNEIAYRNFNEAGAFNRATEYTYDPFGNMTEEKELNADGSVDRIYTYEYAYDGKHNWIKKTVFRNSQASYIIEREIAYRQ
jgi:YD repeat-containing protein